MVSKMNPFLFFRQVRTEISKVVWPTRRETGISVLMVLIMVAVVAMFFFLVDSVMSFGVSAGISFLSGLFR